MKAIVRAFSFCGVILTQLGCSQKPAPMFTLSPRYHDALARKPELLRKARSGDSDAAYQLSIIHGVYLRNDERSKFWLKQADVLGNPEAKRIRAELDH